MYSSEWKTPVLTVKNKKYYLKDEVDVLLQQLHEQWKEQQQELEDCREALANYQAQERRIASVLIQLQEICDRIQGELLPMLSAEEVEDESGV